MPTDIYATVNGGKLDTSKNPKQKCSNAPKAKNNNFFLTCICSSMFTSMHARFCARLRIHADAHAQCTQYAYAARCFIIPARPPGADDDLTCAA